jgi:hypothetical protein
VIQEFSLTSSSVFAVDCPFQKAAVLLKGYNPGWLFVDDRNTPRLA